MSMEMSIGGRYSFLNTFYYYFAAEEHFLYMRFATGANYLDSDI